MWPWSSKTIVVGKRMLKYGKNSQEQEKPGIVHNWLLGKIDPKWNRKSEEEVIPVGKNCRRRFHKEAHYNTSISFFLLSSCSIKERWLRILVCTLKLVFEWNLPSFSDSCLKNKQNNKSIYSWSIWYLYIFTLT